MKKVIAAILLLCLTLGLCACVSGNPDSTNATEDTKQTEASGDPTKATEEQLETYVVTVVDSEGKPVGGAVVQLCKMGGDGSCTPGSTNAQGQAIFKMTKDEYKVSFVVIPAAYTYADDVKEFYFEEGSVEMTIVLNKA